MLHDPSHVPQVPMEEEIILTRQENDILRRLGSRIAEISSLPVHKEKARLWRKMNEMEPTYQIISLIRERRVSQGPIFTGMPAT